MKRNDAIKLIQDTFEFEGTGTQMREKDAEAILKALEKAGMTPPAYEPFPGSDHLVTFRSWERDDA